MNDQQAQFLPFHAINDFMRSDYRLEVIRTALNALGNLPDEFSAPIERLTRRLVQVPGFRNTAKAPIHLRVKPTAAAFEKSHQLVAAILHAWTATNPELSQQVYDLLISRNWEVLQPNIDRTKLPGFISRWPPKENFEILTNAFREMYPQAQTKDDDVNLMIVWISTRLPCLDEDESHIQEYSD